MAKSSSPPIPIDRRNSEPMQVLSVRLPADLIKQLPKPSLKGRRAQFIREAIIAKLRVDS